MKPAHTAVAAGLAILAVLALIGWWWMLVPISQGHVGVHTDRGAATGETFEPGWNYHNPVTQGYEVIETRPVTVNMIGDSNIYVITSDGQDVWVDVTVRYSVDDPVTFFEEARSHSQAVDRFVDPAVRSEMRSQAADLPTSDMVAASDDADRNPGIITREGRTLLEDTAMDALQESLDGTGITVHSVDVRNVELNEQFSAELEAIAIEEAEREQKIIAAQAEADAERERAEGIADANERIHDSLTDEVLVDKYIDAIDESDTVIVATDGDGVPIIIDVENDGGGDDE